MVTEVITEEGIQFEVVQPGGPADPFTKNQTPQVPSPAPVANVVPAVDGSKTPPAAPPVQTPAIAAPTAPAQAVVPSPVPATPAPELTPMQKAIADGKLDEYVAGLVKESTGSALRSQQSGYDKRIDALEKSLKDAREANLKAEREGKLTNEDLSEEEKDLLRGKWEIEDEKARLDNYSDELDVYFRSIYVAAQVQEHAQFGVTAEDLEQFTEPEEMDAFVAAKELDFYRSGRHLESATTSIPSRTVETPGSTPINSEQAAPPGASAPSDLGGNAVVTPPTQLNRNVGFDAMRENLNKLPWETPLPG